jgi:uncharacterized protein (TIGR02246 family)
MRRNLQVLLFTVALASSGLHGQNEPELSTVRRAIDESHRTYAAAMKARDAAALARHFTEDGMLLPPSGDIRKGRGSIEQWFGTWLPTTIIHEFNVNTDDAALAGDTAYEVGRFRMTRVAQGATERSSDVGKYLMVWKRGADGTWRIARDMFNKCQIRGNEVTPTSNAPKTLV